MVKSTGAAPAWVQREVSATVQREDLSSGSSLWTDEECEDSWNFTRQEGSAVVPASVAEVWSKAGSKWLINVINTSVHILFFIESSYCQETMRCVRTRESGNIRM